ncbi:hypothetical protein, conserved [Trypanosoma brucei gambiense DAL972]|uniref:Uncharacterized protein n=1 Tax=Trypanosoma brucei gambiense (strain MHOM/CI/86/DAL972) TaxID=679716 RepID=C9ZS78_TRYB9|nr:hypothetical protein, conserved [Trypanosoma brucei gambiense DAL972]CBH12214.1 hypothetical protein, conserved [Trypanosoma brucei gambiense DAL972]|eukprot:XP_011774497.1 hypothetical protein, conserved [Trypanosoma brucei gambiense DAL972]
MGCQRMGTYPIVGVEDVRRAVVLEVNDFCISVKLPPASELRKDSRYGINLDAQVVGFNARRVRDEYELAFRMYLTGNDLEKYARRCTVGYLFLPSGEEHYLGPIIFGSDSVCSAMLVGEVPSNVEVCFECLSLPRGMTALMPACFRLAEIMATILDADVHNASVASSHMQNLVKLFPSYGDCMMQFDNWTKFVECAEAQLGLWCTRRYTEDEIKKYGFRNVAHYEEPRLVSKRFIYDYVDGDVGKDALHHEKFEELKKLVAAALNSCTDCRRPSHLCKKHLTEISSMPCVLQLNPPNYLAPVTAEGIVWRIVLQDPLHPIRVVWERKVTRVPDFR